ncbi:rod shape-determining protein MreD [Magnetofaba australis]|uniref:Putative rod shape-determining protein MreD n=1 Tax=Magnetofaba australis IT-1 TaxID=1434232 RepID=A0A1Y2K2J2_9PROT|nr:rod shape-determining protein MreD [Magnetofaba australis]OSM02192.1 putative rod shape-determining protein MreD [Magnetofaba australis IT-1]
MILASLSRWIPALTLILAVAIQELALPWRAWSVFRPDLALLCLFYWRLYRPDLCGPLLAFLIGLLIDMVSGAPLGLNAFSKTLFILPISYFGARLRATDFLFLLPVVALLGAGEQLVQWVTLLPLQQGWARWDLVAGRVISTALCAPLVVAGLIHLHRTWLEETPGAGRRS